MSRSFLMTASFLVTLLFSPLLSAFVHKCPPVNDCLSDIPANAGLLTSPPTDLVNVSSVVPLGNLNPEARHVESVDHMYLSYPTPNGGGTDSYAVYNMAPGKLFMLFRQKNPAYSDYDYQISISHTCSVYSYFDHLHGLSDTINDYLVYYKIQWIDLSGMDIGPWVIFLGQKGGPAMLSLPVGKKLGVTKNYYNSWDVGLVDTRQINGQFANPNDRRYPSVEDLATVFPIALGIDLSIYNLGNKILNAACFIDYMDNSAGMQSNWFNKLGSTPKSCGAVGWDTVGNLRGAWFNPALDSLPSIVFDYELAALSIIPDNYNPTTRIQIGFGNAASGMTIPNLALLDPINWVPSITAPQITNPFYIYFDTTLGAVVNPEPSVVGIGTTVCYDLAYVDDVGMDKFNSILFNMLDASHLKIKYDPTAYSVSQCNGLATAFPIIDASWIEYVR